MEEEWKDIKGYEGYYKISNLGRVKSLYRVVRKKNGCTMTVYPRILRSVVNSNGYLDVSLLKDAHSKTFLVHILVATAFLPNPNNFPVFHHRDGNKTNCHVDNLQWCSYSYNTKHAYDYEGHKHAMMGKTGKDNKLSRVIGQYNIDGTFVSKFNSLADVERELGFREGHISRCAIGQKKTAYGFVWKFLSEAHFHYGIEQIKNGRVICRYSTIQEATIAVGLKSLSSISAVVNGHKKTAAGYEWRVAAQ